MISINFTELNESLKDFTLSVAIGPEVVIKSLLDTANRHLDVLESISTETINAELQFKCSVNIISQVYNVLTYINFHSTDVLSLTDDFKSPLDSELEVISSRFAAALLRWRTPNVR